MDAVKKVEREKRIVIGLTIIFVIVFITGPLKSLGVFRRGSPVTDEAPPKEATVNVAKSIGVLLQERWERVESPREEFQAAVGSADTAQAAPGYTASELRDPLKSFLPVEALPEPVQERVAQAPFEPPPPPMLRVQGLLWGGPAPQAIINEGIYGVGDHVAGTTILTIDRRGVTVDHFGAAVFYATKPASLEAAWR